MKKNLFEKIIISLFIIYTLVGFFWVPSIIKEQLIKNLDNTLITKTSLEKVYFNPFTLKIELNNFSLSKDEKKLIAFEKLYIDFSLLKSLHESHISFKSLDLVKPYIDIIQDEKGTINLATLLKPQEENKAKEEETSSNTSIPNFKITKTQIIEGNFLFTQIFKGKNTTTNLKNFNYTFYELGTYKNSLASHNLNTVINENTKLFVEGGFRLIPFKMYGKVKLQNLKPNEYLGYSKDMLNFSIGNPNLNLSFGYRVDTTNDLILFIDNTNLSIKNLKLIKDKEELISLNSFNINNLNLDLSNQKLNIETISLDKLIANVVSNKQSNLNFENLINIKDEIDNSKDIKKEEKESKPWLIDLDKISLNNSTINFNDLKDNIKLQTNNINISLDESSIKDENITIKSLNLEKTNLNLVEKTDIDIENINLNLKNISYNNGEIKIDNSQLLTKEFKIIDKNAKTDISGKNIDIKINSLIKNEKLIKLSSIDMKEPVLSIVLGKQEITKEKSKEIKNKKTEIKKESDSSTILDIGPINIKNANLIFEDKNLPIPFKTDISKLNGEISELKSTSSKPSKLNLEGKIDKYGYTRITGIVDHKDIKNLTDVNMIFKNIAIKNFTPYSGKFVGRELEDGKLNLNLNYNIKKSNLEAKNSIVITNIKLGDIVKSEEAVSLPLDLAIALLEDTNGVINLNIPITGNLNDPQFSIGPIVWKAFTNILFKAVSAPFSLLASLLGIEEKELNSTEFIYGESKLLASEKESLDNIAKALQQRPNLALKVLGTYNKLKDTDTLQYIKVEDLIKIDMQKIKEKDSYLVALENRYLELKEKMELEELKKTFIIKTKDDKEFFDKNSYIKFLKRKVAKSLIIKDEELINLAKQRANSVKTYLETTHKISSNRILVKDEIKVLDDKDAEYVRFDLEIDVVKK